MLYTAVNKKVPVILLDRGCEKKARHKFVKRILLFALTGTVLLIALPLAIVAILKTRKYELL